MKLLDLRKLVSCLQNRLNCMFIYAPAWYPAWSTEQVGLLGLVQIFDQASQVSDYWGQWCKQFSRGIAGFCHGFILLFLFIFILKTSSWTWMLDDLPWRNVFCQLPSNKSSASKAGGARLQIISAVFKHSWSNRPMMTYGIVLHQDAQPKKASKATLSMWVQ